MTNNKFRTVTEPDSRSVTVRLWQSEEGPQGEFHGPTLSGGGQISMAISPPGPAAGALGSAIQHANTVRADIVVMDPDGVWQLEWGELA